MALMTSDLLSMISHPLFRTQHHFMYDIKSNASDFTSTVSVSSHPPYRWHHSHYMAGITSSISATSYPLCFWQNIYKVWHHNTLCWCHQTRICMTSFALHMTKHSLYHTKAQYLWFHIHFRHHLTPPVSDIAPTVTLSSKPLHWFHTHFCMTSHPPTVWHPMHYREHHI